MSPGIALVIFIWVMVGFAIGLESLNEIEERWHAEDE